MTPQQLKALKLALEALEQTTHAFLDTEGSHGRIEQEATDAAYNAITALEEVLAEHAMRETQRLGQEIEQKIGCVNHDCEQCKAQPEQEPVAWMDKYGEIYKDVPEVLSTDKPLYTTPPQRTWVGLTGLDQKELMAMSARDAVFATEAKLKEKNT